jgi:dUTP pyrophosphatase
MARKKLEIEFINLSENPNPEFKEGNSGFDIRANLSDIEVIKPGERKLIPTGLYFNIPENHELQIRPRSGLAINQGITVLNSPGTVDENYIGEIQIILINHGHKRFVIQNGDRIAQGVFAAVNSSKLVNLNQVSEINKKTKRGATGFGASGIK